MGDAIALEVLDATTPIPGFWPNTGGAILGTASYSGFVPAFTISYVPN